tara:strand:- start:60 stop:404 length:345 start_codon:yes stop_codon:yes gene_type:complete
MKILNNDIKPEDFIIGISPALDENNVWTGEINMNIVTSKDNPMSDDDYYSLLHFCKVICSSVPVMESDSYVKEKLTEKADQFEEDIIPKKKGKVVDKHDNVVVLSFDADTDGNA